MSQWNMQYFISTCNFYWQYRIYTKNNYKNIFNGIYILPQSCYLGWQRILYRYDGRYFMQICCTVLNEKWETIQQEPYARKIYIYQIQEAFFFSKSPKLLQPIYFVCNKHKHYKENKKLCMLQCINKRYSQSLKEDKLKIMALRTKKVTSVLKLCTREYINSFSLFMFATFIPLIFGIAITEQSYYHIKI
jgi:hypothetical protein